jgi:hypothetical protein
MLAAGFLEHEIEHKVAAQVNGGGERAAESTAQPPVAGARLGRTPDGQPAWFISDPDRPGKYMQLSADA